MQLNVDLLKNGIICENLVIILTLHYLFNIFLAVSFVFTAQMKKSELPHHLTPLPILTFYETLRFDEWDVDCQVHTKTLSINSKYEISQIK